MRRGWKLNSCQSKISLNNVFKNLFTAITPYQKHVKCNFWRAMLKVMLKNSLNFFGPSLVILIHRYTQYKMNIQLTYKHIKVVTGIATTITILHQKGTWQYQWVSECYQEPGFYSTWDPLTIQYNFYHLNNFLGSIIAYITDMYKPTIRSLYSSNGHGWHVCKYTRLYIRIKILLLPMWAITKS